MAVPCWANHFLPLSLSFMADNDRSLDKMIYSFISSTDIDWSLATCQVLCLQQDPCFKGACILGGKAGNQAATPIQKTSPG